MEVWNQRFFLALVLLLCVGHLLAAEEDQRLIEPTPARADVRKAKLDTEDFEFGLYGGVINIEDFGSSPVLGARLTYHMTEDFFVEGDYGRTELKETSFERLSGSTQLLTNDQRDVDYYNLSVGYNLFPGEVFIGSSLAFYSAGYVKAGIGNMHFADEEHVAYTVGAGFKVYATDFLSLHLDVRDHIMSHDLLGENRTTQNLEAVIGLTCFF